MLPWTELQAPGPGPYRNQIHICNKHVCTDNDVFLKGFSKALTITSDNDMLDVLGSGFLDPILALNSSTERDLDNLSSKTNV